MTEYVATVRVASTNLLVRVEVKGLTANYIVTYGDGDTYTYEAPTTGAMGALKGLIRDLCWSSFAGTIDVVQSGTLGDDDLIQALAELRPIIEYGYSQTPEALQ